MKKAVILAITMLLAILYLAIPESKVTYDFFPFDDHQVTLQMHVWFILNKLTFALFAFIIWKESQTYRKSCAVFFGIQAFKVVEYLLWYNNSWKEIETEKYVFYITSTTVGFTILCSTIAWEYLWKDHQ